MGHIILVGKPGCGKGTIAKILQQKGYTVISGSDVLRENSKDESAKYYKEARYSLDNGVLIDSKIINGMITEKVKSLPSDARIVFDGYPRKIEQAQHLASLFNLDDVSTFMIDIPDSVVIERISSRLTCKSCAAPFNSVSQPPKKEGVCDHCGGEVYQRPDDNAETIQVRLDEYEKTITPIINFLKPMTDYHLVNYTEERTSDSVIELILNS